MFGRKGLGGSGAGDGGATPERRDFEGVVREGGSLDRALCASIALFSEVLAAAGEDPGALGMEGGGSGRVGELLAQSITYTGAAGPEYVTLGVSQDFKAFSYQPHCFLFLVSNAVGICEDLPDTQTRAQIAASECAVPLFHAHVMRRWASQVVPVGKAMAANDGDALHRAMMTIQHQIRAVIDAAPPWMRERVDLDSLAADWLTGYPATIGRPIDETVRRLNGLPMSDFVHQTLTDWMANLQMQGMARR